MRKVCFTIVAVAAFALAAAGSTAALMHVIDEELCTQCGECIKSCPEGAIKEITKGKEVVYLIDQELCTQCGECVKSCPLEAIVVKKAKGEKFSAKKKRGGE